MVTCAACRQNNYIPQHGDGAYITEYCQKHRDEWQHWSLVEYLKGQIPNGLHVAAPSKIDQRLREWSGVMGLYLYGKVGVGKSYAAAALTKRWCTLQQKAGEPNRVAWRNLPMLILDTASRYGRNENGGSDWDDLAVFNGLVVLDDIGIDPPKEWTRTRYYALFESRLQRRLPTIITSNMNLAELTVRLDSPQITSRISMLCTQFELTGEDRRIAQSPALNASRS